MDLENFPTSESARRMLQTVTGGFYDNSYVGKWIYQVMGLEMDDAIQKYNELLLQIFPETATWGLVYHEQKYGITTDETIDIEERRKNVLLSRNYRQPLNPAFIENQVKIIVGHERVGIVENVSAYTFALEITEIDQSGADYSQVKKYVNSIKPSHLTLLMVGKYGADYYVNINYSNTIQINSSFYPRYNLPILWIDGTWLVDGSYYLSGYKHNKIIDFYPVKSRIIDDVKAGPEMRSKLTVEDDLWFLDGALSLNGEHYLKAAVYEIFDEDM